MRKNLLLKVMMCSRYILFGLLIQSFPVGTLTAAIADAQEIKSVKEVYIDIRLSNAPITDVFRLIEQKTSYRFSYDRHDLNNRNRFDLNESTISVADLLMILSERGDLKFRQINNYINVSKLNKENNDSPKLEIIIQTRNITGTVTSQEDGTLPGVNVIEKG
jgi:TonB-dependent starch-binding outer membrane protein SusC